ncbi:hypothetical protein UB31_27915 [Bradyrhizobium sp. LTSP849]|uniref:hypothetical protein n=1 Tax=Bradyrhizobium sp. LTSP849 TaxID=1615890 RepID=UPI0005D1511A|nr:hypothetical protein [Bradyrhizobium sp. LTSP849]KJC40134.1 hypothetical protein UB31_27915 [Bradyrhizobium sp. LTSP849]
MAIDLYSGIARNLRILVLAVVSCGVEGCGLAVPDIKEVWDADRPPDPDQKQPKIPGAAQIEWEIKKKVYCELRDAVQAVNDPVNGIPVTEQTVAGKVLKKQPGLIPSDWQAQVSLSLQVDEVSSLIPGVTFTQILPNATQVFGAGNSFTTSQSTSLGLGGTLSSSSTRIDKFDPYYSVASLMDKHRGSACKDGGDPWDFPDFKPASSSPFILESDLGIRNWLLGAMMVDNMLPSEGSPPQALGGGGKDAGAKAVPKSKGEKPSANPDITIDTVTYEIKFIVVTSGSITPTWKLIKFSANTAGAFLGAGRTRTHDLIITLGPPTGATSQTHFASQVGNAVSNGNRSAVPGSGM